MWGRSFVAAFSRSVGELPNGQCLQTFLQGLAVRWIIRRKVNCAPKMSDGQLKLATRRKLHTALVVGDRLLPKSESDVWGRRLRP